ncbi:MAG: 30S ribosomal protein S6 [Bacteroidia bacterium]|nr:30S ribosomal protein S6 [Bacteroidia bacterium]
MVNLRNYETTYIITPELSQEECNAVIDKFKNLLLDSGGEIINQEIWGFRKLAYPINKKQSGFYVYTEFRAEPNFIARLEREYEYDDRIIRYLTVALDKYAVAYNQKRKEKGKIPVALEEIQSKSKASQIEIDTLEEVAEIDEEIMDVE